MNNYLKAFLKSIIISMVGVLGIDLLTHTFLSTPNETFGYFAIKFILFLVFSFIFLLIFKKPSFYKVAIGGIIVSLIFGFYYNILPLLTGYSTYGISLRDISFLGAGIFLTGLAFGIVHTLAFVVGFYSSKIIDLFPPK